MKITTLKELDEKRKKDGTIFLVKDGLSKEYVIDQTPYLSADYRTEGIAHLVDENFEEVTFIIELDKEITTADLHTLPEEGTKVELLPRLENPTLEQIKEAVEEYDDTMAEKDSELFAYAVSDFLRYLPKIGRVELTEDFGGEGQGDHAHVIFEIAGKHYKLDGYYSSWEGTEWDGSDQIYEVVPKEVQVTEWVKA